MASLIVRQGSAKMFEIGTMLKDPENPVELGHIVRSFDACLVCAVHVCTKR